MKKLIIFVIGFIFISCLPKANNENNKKQEEEKTVIEIITSSKWEMSDYINAFGDINKDLLYMNGYFSKVIDPNKPFNRNTLSISIFPNSTLISVDIDGKRIHKLTERYIGVKTSEEISVLSVTHVFTILDNDLYTSMKFFKNKEEDPVSEERRLSIFNADRILYENDFFEYLKANKSFELEIRTSTGGEYIFDIDSTEFSDIYNQLVSLWREYGIK